MLMGIADHQADAGERGNFFRRALRIAAGHQDPGIRILR